MIGRQFLVYVGVGILTALLDIGLMQSLLGLGLDHRLAVTAGFAAGLVFNYFTHLRVTFRANHSAAAIAKFALLVLVNWLLTLLCVTAGLALADSVLLGKLVSLPVVAVNGFLWGKYWIFRQGR